MTHQTKFEILKIQFNLQECDCEKKIQNNLSVKKLWIIFCFPFLALVNILLTLVNISNNHF